MQESITLTRVEPLLGDLSYPVSRRNAVASLDGVTVFMADGNADLGELVRNCLTSESTDVKNLYYELNNTMPIETFGEPGQSDGDAWTVVPRRLFSALIPRARCNPDV